MNVELVQNEHPDERATCYVVRGRGFVVISSSGHDTGKCPSARSLPISAAASPSERESAVAAYLPDP